MIIRKLRLDKGLSQEQLADMAGISTRTLQRLERGAKASPETLKCLAAVLEVEFNNLREEQIKMTKDTTKPQPPLDASAQSAASAPDSPKPETELALPELSQEEREAMEYVRDIKAFYTHALAYGCVMGFLLAVNVILYPGRINVFWPAFGWGIGLFIHALSTFEVFNFLGDDWEKKQIKKRLTRNR